MLSPNETSVICLYSIKSTNQRRGNKRERRKKNANAHQRNFILSYRRFIFLYHITNHCIVSSSSRNNCCSMLFYVFVSDWPMVNYCKCEWDRERGGERDREKKGKKGVLLLLYIIDAWLAVTVAFSLFLSCVLFLLLGHRSPAARLFSSSLSSSFPYDNIFK